MTLTPAAIKAAAPGDTLKDTVVSGLQLRSLARGKSFYLYYRSKDGQQRKPKIGDWPGLTIPKARRIARSMLDLVAAGQDPSAERQKARKAPIVRDMGKRYMIEHGQHKKSSAEDQRRINQHINPRIGTRRVSSIDYDIVFDLHRKITKHVGPVEANRVLSLVSKMLNMCELWKWRELHSNPCKHVSRNKERPRQRYMTAEEATKIWRVINEVFDERPQAVVFILLLIYTGARKNEIAQSTWNDLDEDVIGLPDSKNKEPRLIFLPPQVMHFVNSLPRTNKTIVGIQEPYKTWNRIRKAAGCPDLRIHDLRHSFASAALAAGFDLGPIGAMLGHKSAQTTKRYAHLIKEIGRANTARTADFIEGRMKSEVKSERR